MKIRTSLLFLLILTFSFTQEISGIRADDVVSSKREEKIIEGFYPFVNSQNPIGEDLQNLAHTANGDLEVRNNGGYKYGVPGVYNVTYGIKGTEMVETVALTVVESKGTLLGIEVVDGNVIVLDMDDTSWENFDYLSVLDDYASNKLKARCLVQRPSGELTVFESDLTQARSGAGGAPGYYDSSYVSTLAMPYYSGPIEEKNVWYYNPIDLEGYAIETRLGCLQKSHLKSMIVSDDDGKIKIRGEIGEVEGQNTIVECKTDLNITSTMMGTDKFEAYNIDIVDSNDRGGIPIPIPNGKFNISMEIPRSLDADKIEVYEILFDRSKKKIEATRNGDRMELVTNQLPVTLVLVEGEIVNLEPKPTISLGANSSWQLGNTTGLIIKSDADFSSFLGVMVDGEEIDRKHYTAKEGSTIIELSPEYLSTLSIGNHTITILSTLGNCETGLSIASKSKNEYPGIVKTGDNTSIDIILLGMLLSISTVAYYLKKRNQISN